MNIYFLCLTAETKKTHDSLVFRNGIVDSISVWYHWRWGSRHSRKSTKASGHCKVPVSTTAWNNEWIRLFFYLSKKGTPCLNSNPLSWNNFGVWPRVILAAMASPNKCLSQPRPCLHSFISLVWHLTASWYNPCKVWKKPNINRCATRCWYFFILLTFLSFGFDTIGVAKAVALAVQDLKVSVRPR